MTKLTKAFFIVLVFYCFATGSAEDEETVVPAPSAAPQQAVKYVFPDLPDGKLPWTKFDTKVVSGVFFTALLIDQSFFDQDTENISQVGEQEDQTQLRGGRFGLSGRIKVSKGWNYFLAANFNGFDLDPGKDKFNFLDVAFAIPVGSDSRLWIGKMKEPWVYEMAADAASQPFLERILSPFFNSRNIGLRLDNGLLNGRATWSIGVFNKWFEKDLKFSESGTQISSRFTGLPYWSEDGRRFLHLGVAARHSGADAGKIRLKGNPESNVTDPFVDTVSFTADHQNELGLEFVFERDQFQVLAEHTDSWVNSVENGNPHFHGSYITANYVFTGENRIYDKRAGYTRGLIPKGRWGAFEGTIRFSHVDLDDGQIHGAEIDKWLFALGWWPTKRWRIEAGYGMSDLDRSGIAGRMHSLLLRAQWVY